MSNPIQIQPSKPPTASKSIENVETSIANLIRSWNRRQRWQLCFNSRQDVQDLGGGPWRTKLIIFLESTPIHLIALCLLIFDLVLTVLELSSSLLSCSRIIDKTKEAWYHWVGIAILGLLSMKSMALVVGLGGSFFRRPGYVVDGLVVIGALVLELFLERKGGGLLVVLSLWRIVRVVESAFELSDEAIEAQIESIVAQFEALRDENKRLLESIQEKDEMIEKLEDQLAQLKHAY